MWNYGTPVYEDFGDYGSSWQNPSWMNTGDQNWTDITLPGEGTFNTGMGDYGTSPALVGGFQPMGSKTGSVAPMPASTGPISDVPMPQWSNLNVPIEGSPYGEQVPYLNKSWIGMQAARPRQSYYEGDTERIFDMGAEAGYGFNQSSLPDYLQKYLTNPKNYEWGFDPQTGAPSLKIKAGDKTGTTVQYRDAGGYWEPIVGEATNTRWDTNDQKESWKALIPLAAAAGFAGLAAASPALVGVADAATIGATGAGAGALGSEAALAGLGGVEPIATSGFTAAQGGIGSYGAGFGLPGGVVAGEAGGGILGLSNMAGIGTGASAGMGAVNAYNAAAPAANGLPLEAAQYLPEAEAAISGAGANAPLYGGTNGTAAFSGLSSIGQITELVKQGMSVSEAIKQIMGGGGGAGGGAGGSGVAGGNNGILDLIAGLYSAKQMKDYSGNLKDMYSSQLGRQQPFYNQLLASYQDPNTFYNSNQWKGLESVYQNSIDRQAAKVGRLANPTDREVLLQAHAMKQLENYRSGLRGDVQATDPAKYADAYAKGLQAEAYANAAPWAAIGNMANRPGGVAGSVATTVGQIDDILKAGGDIWDVISGWFDTEEP